MTATDYRCTDDNIATVPYIAHKVIIQKHKRREKALTVALVVSVAITILSNIMLR